MSDEPAELYFNGSLGLAKAVVLGANTRDGVTPWCVLGPSRPSRARVEISRARVEISRARVARATALDRARATPSICAR